MGFDIQNFGIGLLTGWASAYGVYRYRHIVKGIIASAQNQATTARNAATRSADSRLMGDLVRRCENSHMAGPFVKLTDVLVEPRFLAAPALAMPPDDDELEDVFRVVPRVHDLPFLHAPFNIPSLTISELGEGSRALALLGMPGSGRTTALHAIALFSLNRVRFQVPTDTVNAMIEEEEAKLPEKERAQRVQDRLKMELQAREKLAEERGITFESRDETVKQTVPLFNRLMPLYISFEFFDFAALSRGEVDPAEPLVRAVQASVDRVTAMTMPGNVYERLNAGQVLLLLDGFDELTGTQQSVAQSWLRAFLAQYQHNFIIVTGPVRGFGVLTRLGLTPVFMRPWQDFDVKQAVKRWAAALPRMKNKKMSGARKASDEAKELAMQDIRALTPYDLTLKIWGTLTADDAAPEIREWYRVASARLISDKRQSPELQSILIQLAQLQLQEGVIRRSRMVELGIADPSVVTTDPQQLPDTLRDEMEPTGKRAAKAAQETVKKLGNPQAKLLAGLQKSGLLLRCGAESYRFRHIQIAAHYASFGLNEIGIVALMERTRNPAWQSAIAFAAMHMSVDRIVQAHLQSATDVLTTDLADAARWLRYAAADAHWRGNVLKQLANVMMAPNQYPLVRERAAAALVGSGDLSILFILRKAARNQSAAIRRLACLAMGAIGDPASIPDLRSLVQDKQAEVQLAAAMSLGAIANEAALEAMVVAFTQDAEPVRKAIAEAFAALPEDGHPILYDANRADDLILRRVSIAGIRRIRAGWALAAIYRTFIQDSEWYVKSAAEAAFSELDNESVGNVLSYPPPDQVVWLNDWLKKRGETMPEGGGIDVLRAALKDSDPQIRSLAAETLGQLGVMESMPSLYDALLDVKQDVRAATHRALGILQLQLGRQLPIPAV
jgi:HEAT repeat protein